MATVTFDHVTKKFGDSVFAVNDLSLQVKDEEFLVLVGAFVYSYWFAIFATLGIVLAAVYILLMYQRTMTGPTVPAVAGFKDLNAREVASLAPLLVLIVVLGSAAAAELSDSGSVG